MSALVSRRPGGLSFPVVCVQLPVYTNYISGGNAARDFEDAEPRLRGAAGAASARPRASCPLPPSKAALLSVPGLPRAVLTRPPGMAGTAWTWRQAHGACVGPGGCRWGPSFGHEVSAPRARGRLYQHIPVCPNVEAASPLGPQSNGGDQ